MPMPADKGDHQGPQVSPAEIYRHAIEEYRFEVQLSWERTRFYLGLNMALLAAVATLLRITSDSWEPLVGISVIGLCASSLGISTIRKAHQYYRRTIWKKTVIEQALGLNETVSAQADQHETWAIATTASQADTDAILEDKDAWLGRKLERRTITKKLILLMWLFIVLHLGVIWFAGCQL